MPGKDRLSSSRRSQPSENLTDEVRQQQQQKPKKKRPSNMENVKKKKRRRRKCAAPNSRSDLCSNRSIKGVRKRDGTPPMGPDHRPPRLPGQPKCDVQPPGVICPTTRSSSRPTSVTLTRATYCWNAEGYCFVVLVFFARKNKIVIETRNRWLRRPNGHQEEKR